MLQNLLPGSFLLALLAALLTGCNDNEVIGGVEKPDLDLTVAIVADSGGSGEQPKLLHKQCVKQQPISEPIEQRWFCEFSFSMNGQVQDCSATLSVHADDHFGVWRPDDDGLNPKTGEYQSGVKCLQRPPA